jgi:hypothetical protein
MAEPMSTGGIPVPTQGEPRFRWFCPKPTVNILFYTDYEGVNLDSDVDSIANEFGVRILRDLLVGDDSDVATFQIALLNRHEPTQASQKLTSTLLEGFDQVWFFGIRLANRTSEPDNELTNAEVAALAAWMADGGVLMAGDHSNPRPSDADPHLNPLLNLGRAIGHRVPRAGALRRWEGGPPISGSDAYNTQVPTPEVPIGQIESLVAQEDEWPQQLILKTYAPSGGGPLDPTQPYGRRVHRLFCGRTAPITAFPDHMHEGHLIVPTTLPADTWPSGPSGQPRPEVIAQGTDKRSGEIYDLVVAYDGDEADVGRVVADSTWHHYFNVNLKGFPSGGSVLSQLAQYYVNLAVWLSPRSKRAQISCWLLWKLLHSPTVEMAYRNSRSDLGRAAAGVLRRTAGPCVIRDVFDPVARSTSAGDLLLPSEEVLLGGVLHAFFDAFERADTGEEIAPEEDVNALVARGIRAVHDDFVAELEQRVGEAQQARGRLEEHLRPDVYGGGAAT